MLCLYSLQLGYLSFLQKMTKDETEQKPFLYIEKLV